MIDAAIHRVPVKLLKVTAPGCEVWSAWRRLRGRWECYAVETGLGPLRLKGAAFARQWLKEKGWPYRWCEMETMEQIENEQRERSMR